MRFMIEDHKKDLDAFQREADKGQDPEVKAICQQTAPGIEKTPRGGAGDRTTSEGEFKTIAERRFTTSECKDRCV
jgi:Domain of unknown function (DUF4142)